MAYKFRFREINVEQIIADSIRQIEENHCKKCDVGKALADMRALLDERIKAIPERIAAKSERKPARDETNRAKRETKAPSAEKKCNGCGKVKAIDAFPRNKTCRDGHAGTCKQCNYDRAKKNAAKKSRANGRNGNHRSAPPAVAESKKEIQVPLANLDSDGLFNCPVKGCDASLLSQAAYEMHYRVKHAA